MKSNIFQFLFFLWVFFSFHISNILAQKNGFDANNELSVQNNNSLSNFFQNYTPLNYQDSTHYLAYKRLQQFTSSEEIKSQILMLNQMINENSMNQEMLALFQFRKKVDSLNQLRNRFLTDYWQHQEMLKLADTSLVSTEDSSFIDILEAVFYQDTLNTDSIFMALAPYNDSLLLSIDQTIFNFSKNEVLQWIREMRQDTTEFFLVGIDGDSLKVRMYKNNPQIIKFSITDYWGTSLKAVIRDIGTNSFKILIDDTAELEYQTDEKAKEAMGKLINKDPNQNRLTVNKRPVEKRVDLWKKGGTVQFDISQIQLSKSWMKGGQSSLAYMASLELIANYKKENISWDNKGIFKYGAISQGEMLVFKPSEDRIEITSKYGHKMFKNYYLTALGSFKSQFAPAHTYPNDSTRFIVSKFMNPGYITFAVGLDFKPNLQTTIFFSPVTSKSTYVTDRYIDETKYGLDSAKTVRHETGAIIKATHKMKIWETIEMENAIELFSNYVHNPQNVDVDWEVKFVLPVNDFIKATFSTRIIYDDDQPVPDKNNEGQTTKAIQFKEFMAIGFAMKF